MTTTRPLHSKATKCRVCSSTLLQCVLPISPIPIGEHYQSKYVESDHPRFPMDIYQCLDCTAVQTLDDIDPDYLWKNYTYFSGHTQKIIDHFSEFVEDLIDNYPFKDNPSVLDIGSNDGSLLKAFQNRGFVVEGIDPADTVVNVANSNNIPTYLGLFNSRTAQEYFPERKYDVITAFNVFAHSSELQDMAYTVSTLLNDNGIFCFEVQYLLDIVQKKILGTFFHEHMVHYSLSSAMSLVSTHGLEIIDYRRNNIQNGSIIFICRKSSSSSKIKSSTDKLKSLMLLEDQAGLSDTNWGTEFYQDILLTRHQIVELVNSLPSGTKFAGYGAARSGPTLAIQYQFEQYLSCLFDDHHSKVGLFAPLKGLKVLPTSQLSASDYPFIFILAYIHYKPIIRNSINYLSEGGSIIIVWPSFQLITKENYKEYV